MQKLLVSALLAVALIVGAVGFVQYVGISYVYADGDGGE